MEWWEWIPLGAVCVVALFACQMFFVLISTLKAITTTCYALQAWLEAATGDCKTCEKEE